MNGRARAALLVLVALPHLAATPWDELPDGNAAEGVVRQQILPGLDARIAAAKARSADIAAFFAGDRGLVDALPSLAGRDLGDPTVLAAALQRLDDAGVARALDRTAAVPEVGRSRDRLASRWAATLDAEDAADAATRRVLLGLRGVLQTHPTLSSARLASEIRRLTDTRRALDDGRDPDDRDALRTIAGLDDDLARWNVLVTTLRSDALTGAHDTDVGPELAAVGTDAGVRTQSAIGRLVAAEPFLDDATRTAANDAVRAWLDAVVAPLRERTAVVVAALEEPEPASDDPTPDVEACAERLASARAWRDALPAGEDGSIAAMRRTHAEAVLALRTAELELAQAVAEQVQTAESAALAAGAEEARAAAAAAIAAAARGEEVPRTELIRTQSESWTKEAMAVVGNWQAALVLEADQRNERLTKARAAVRSLQAGRALADGETPDTLSSSLRTEITALRRLVLAGPPSADSELAPLAETRPTGDRSTELDALAEQAGALEDATERAAALEQITQARAALLAETRPEAEVRQVAADIFEGRLLDLRHAKQARHDLAAFVGPKTRASDRALLTSDVRHEVALFQPQATALLLDRASKLRSFPEFARTGGLGRVLRDSLSTVLLLAVWLWLRSRRRDLSRQLVTTLSPVLDPATPLQRASLALALERLFRPTVDLLLAWVLYTEAKAILPELGIVVGVFGRVAFVRVLAAVVGLFVSKHDDPRITLITVSDASEALITRTFRVLGTWWVVGWIVDQSLQEIVYADAIGSIFRNLWVGTGVLIVLVFARSWESRLEGRVRRAGDAPTWVDRWLALPSGRWHAPARALVFGAYLAAWAAWDLAQGTAARGDSYGALVAVMDRVRFGGGNDAETDEDDGVPLSDEQLAALLSSDVPPEVLIERTEVRKNVAHEFGEWAREQRRGTLVLTGDRGDGKDVFLERIKPMLRVGDAPPRHCRIDRRLQTRGDAIAWLSGHFGLEGDPDTIDDLVAAICALPGRAHLVEDVEWAFLRTVGGFDALRTLLYVCNATSEVHFWVLFVHRPAWAYLSRLGSLVNTGVVREVVDLTPMTGPELEELVRRRTEHVGIEVDFRRLENTGPFGAPEEVERKRAVSSYFRLLAESSAGCPLVALHLWGRSLRRRGTDKADVVVIPELAATVIDGLEPLDLFVLTALRTQDRLTLAELVAVINAPQDDVRATVRELEHRGIVYGGKHGFRIDDSQLKVVTRTLRRRHFLQWAV